MLNTVIWPHDYDISGECVPFKITYSGIEAFNTSWEELKDQLNDFFEDPAFESEVNFDSRSGLAESAIKSIPIKNDSAFTTEDLEEFPDYSAETPPPSLITDFNPTSGTLKLNICPDFNPTREFVAVIPDLPEICEAGEVRLADNSCRRLRKANSRRRNNAKDFYRRYLRDKRRD